MRYLLPLFALFCASSLLTAQDSIFKQLALAETKFAITLNDHSLQVASQGITLRAVSDRKVHNRNQADEQINDFAYRAYHLEFAFKQKYKVRDGFEVVEFIEGNEVIHTISLKDSSRKIASVDERRYETNFLAISLEGVPLTMLDSIDRINFRRAR